MVEICDCKLDNAVCLVGRPNIDAFLTASIDGIIHYTSFGECKKFAMDSPIFAIAFSPRGSRFITGGKDGKVRLHNSFDLKIDEVLHTTTKAIKHLSFSSNGLYISICCENEAIALNMAQRDNIIICEGHSKPVLSASFSPNPLNVQSEFLATIGQDRSIKIFDLQNTVEKESKGVCIASLDSIFPSSLIRGNSILQGAWNPKGTFFAIPGLNQLRLVKKENWEIDIVMKEPIGDVRLISWSSNGEFIASCSHGGKIVIWDLCRQSKVSEKEMAADIKSFVWSSNSENHSLLIALLSNGKIAQIDMKSMEKTEKQSINRNRPQKNGKNEEEDESSSNDSFEVVDDLKHQSEKIETNTENDDLKENSEENSEENESIDSEENSDQTGANSIKNNSDSNGFYFKRKRLKSSDNKNPSKIIKDDIVSPPSDIDLKKSSKAVKGEDINHCSFVSGSTPLDKDRRYLVWNSVGSVALILRNKGSIIDIEFSDISLYKQDQIEHSRRFDLGQLSETVLLLASNKDSSAEDNPLPNQKGYSNSFVLCKSLTKSDGNSSSWNLDFGCDIISSLCIGEKRIAIGTMRGDVYLTTFGGLQLEILSFAGPIVTLAASYNSLAVVFQTHCFQGPKLSCAIRDINEEISCVYDGPLPISQGLKWVGFNDRNMFIAIDEDLRVRILVRTLGSNWFLVGDLKHALKDDETFWPTGCYSDRILGVITKKDCFPSVTPKPILTAIAFKTPSVPRLSNESIAETKINTNDTIELEKQMSTDRLFYKDWKNNVDRYNNELINSESESKGNEFRAKIDKSLFQIFYYCVKSQPQKAKDLLGLICTKKTKELCLQIARENDQNDLIELLETQLKSSDKI